VPCQGALDASKFTQLDSRFPSATAVIVSRAPRPALQAFVELFWASDGGDSVHLRHGRERILPKGAAHVAIRLTDEPLRFFHDEADTVGHTMRGGIVGDVRTGPYIKGSSAPTPIVGVQFRPGAATLFLGAPARLFAETHLPLEDLWGNAAAEACARLCDARGLAQRIDVLEAILAARLPRLRGIHPATAAALIHLEGPGSVRDLAERSGYSHRHFARLFTDTVGLNPKMYGRVTRFGRVLKRLSVHPAAPWADLAASTGYADQPHFNREFREFSGLSPGEYRRRAVASPYHVPL